MRNQTDSAYGCTISDNLALRELERLVKEAERKHEEQRNAVAIGIRDHDRPVDRK